MALILGDGFDHYPTAMILNKWDISRAGNAVGTAYGRLSSQGVQITNVADFAPSQQGGLSKNLPAANAAYGFFGQAYYLPAMPISGNFCLNAVYDPVGGSAMHICSMVGADGSVAIGFITINTTTTPVTTLARSAPGVIVAGTWYYLETKVKVNSVTGYMEVLVNGASKVTYSGNTRRGSGNAVTVSPNDYFTNVKIGGKLDVPSNNDQYFDDFYYCDDTGAVNNTYLGDVQLQAIYPNGAGSSTAWTKGGTTPAATNWQGVTEHSPDDDVTYNKSATVGQLDMYVMDDTTATAAAFKGLLFNVRIKKDDATVRTYSTMVKDVAAAGATTAVATRTTPFGSYTNQQDVSELSPTTAAAWTKAGVDAMEAGIKVIS